MEGGVWDSVWHAASVSGDAIVLVFFAAATKVGDVFINVVASVVWLLIGLVASGIWRWHNTRKNRKIWKPFLDAKQIVKVVLTDKPGQKPRSPRKISITDVRAFSDLRNALHDLTIETDLQEMSEITIDDLAGSPFICLGGPKANGITQTVMSRYLPKLPVAVELTGVGPDCVAAFRHGAEVLTPELDEQQRVSVDYGLLVRIPRLDRSVTDSQPALIAFGLHGHGTQQTITSLLISADLRKLIAEAKESNFYALLKFDFKDGRLVARSILAAGTVGYP